MFRLVREFLAGLIREGQAAGELVAGDPELLAELGIRLGASFVLMPDSRLARGDRAATELDPGAPIATEQVVAHMSLFYESIRERGPRTMTSEYSSAVARRYVDFEEPARRVR